MGEYHQITIMEWMDLKEKLRKGLNDIRQSYVRVGFILRRMDDTKAYEAEGYKSVAEFAEKEHGLKPSTTSRWMSINREYSLDGYSESLDPKWMDMNASQLTEMLALPVQDRDMVRPETPREAIRELKRLDKESEVESDFISIVKLFVAEFPELIRELQGKDQSARIDIVAPSGTRSYRKNGMMLMFYEDTVKFKAAGHAPENVSWAAFFAVTDAMEIEEELENEEKDGEAAGEGSPESEVYAAGPVLGEEGQADQPVEDAGGAEGGGTEVEEEPEIDMNPPEEPEPVEKNEENCAGANAEKVDEINENQPNLSAGDFGEKLQEGFEAGLAAGQEIIVDEQGQPAPEPEEAQEGHEDIDLEAIKAEQENQNAIIGKALRDMRADVSRTLKEIDHNMNLQKWTQARKEAERLPDMIKRIEEFVKG